MHTFLLLLFAISVFYVLCIPLCDSHAHGNRVAIETAKLFMKGKKIIRSYWQAIFFPAKFIKTISNVGNIHAASKTNEMESVE